MSILKNYWKNIIFAVYCFIIIFAGCAKESSKLGILLYSFIAVSLISLILQKFWDKKMFIPASPPEGALFMTRNTKFKFSACFFLISFLLLFLVFLAQYPGAFSPDSMDQYRQVMTGVYNDWHPVWHTLLYFTLPLKLTDYSISATVFFQILKFSLLLGFMGITMYEYVGLKKTFLAIGFILINPLTLRIVMYPWKDVAFAMAGGLSMAFAVHVYFTKGNYLKKKRYVVLFAIAVVCATLFRHNAILFTLPLVFAVCMFLPWSRRVLFVCCCFCLFLTIKFPVYTLLDVKKPGGRVIETTSLPLSVIFYVVQNNPDVVNDEVNSFVASVTNANPELVDSYNYQIGFNSIKYNEGMDLVAIEDAGRWNILKMMLHCFRVAPKKSLIAVIGLTRFVWSFEVPAVVGVGSIENSFGAAWKGVRFLKYCYDGYTSLLYTTFTKYIASIGLVLSVMLGVILFGTNFSKTNDVKRLFFCIPIFTYDFGTMLFLGGPDVRFFYVTFIVCPLVLTLFWGKQPEALLERKKLPL